MFSRLTIPPVVKYELFILHLLGLTVIEVAGDTEHPEFLLGMVRNHLNNVTLFWHVLNFRHQ